MVVFALLAGVFFSDSDQADSAPSRHRHKRRTPHLSGAEPLVSTPTPKPKPAGPAGPATDQITNPFLDVPS